MVNLAQDWSFSGAMSFQATIVDALEQLNAQIHQKSIVVAVEIDDEVMHSTCPVAIRRAIEFLLHVAVDRSPIAGDVYVTACTTPRGLEIEIADSGDDEAFPKLRAFYPQDCRPLLNFPACGAGFSVLGSLCPQGGVAWTILARKRVAYSKVA
jgi:hypothetical protein